MTATGRTEVPQEVAFAPAVEDAKVAPGTGFLQPGGLVVHTGWSYPLEGERVLHQHPAYEGGSVQPWNISTPDGRRAACFPYLTRPDAEQGPRPASRPRCPPAPGRPTADLRTCWTWCGRPRPSPRCCRWPTGASPPGAAGTAGTWPTSTFRPGATPTSA